MNLSEVFTCLEEPEAIINAVVNLQELMAMEHSLLEFNRPDVDEVRHHMAKRTPVAAIKFEGTDAEAAPTRGTGRAAAAQGPREGRARQRARSAARGPGRPQKRPRTRDDGPIMMGEESGPAEDDEDDYEEQSDGAEDPSDDERGNHLSHLLGAAELQKEIGGANGAAGGNAEAAAGSKGGTPSKSPAAAERAAKAAPNGAPSEVTPAFG
eukprot:jgi/Tetstr1/441565/TSEL_029794.t1